MYYYLAKTYENLERFDEAINIYQKTIEISKNYKNRVNESESYQDELNLYSAYHHLAGLYRKLTRYKEARDTYKQIVELGIDTSDTHYGLGLTYVGLRDKKAAQMEYDIVVKLFEDEDFDVMKNIIEKEAKELLEQIKSITP